MPHRIILVRPDRVGDAIISTACFEPTLRQLPGAEIYWAGREVMRPLIESNPNLCGFIGWNHQEGHSKLVRSIQNQFELIHADSIIFLHPDPAAQVAAQKAGIPRRIGYAQGRFTKTLTESFPYDKSEGAKHEAEYAFDLLSRLGLRIPAQGLSYSIVLPDSAKDSLSKKLSSPLEPFSYLVINPTAYSTVARWPVAHFISAAAQIRAKYNLKLVLVGDKANDADCLLLKTHPLIQKHGIDLSGQTSLAELGWILKDAVMLIGRNTGTTHLAAAVGCPVVEVFGRTTPLYGATRWRTLGSCVKSLSATTKAFPWESKEDFWKRSYASVTPDQVVDAAIACAAARGLSA